MIEFYSRLVNEKVIPKVEDYNRLCIDDGSYAGTVAWVSDAINYNKAAMDNGFEVVAAPYTADSAHESGNGWYAKPATLYAISRNTQHPKEAALLLDFMLNSKEWAELQGVEKGIPLSASVRKILDEEGQLSGLQYEASLVMEENTHINPMDSTIENTTLIDAFIAACDEVLFDKATSAEAATELYEGYKEGGFV